MESPHTHHFGIWMTVAVAVIFAAVYVGALVVLSHTQKTLAAQAAELAAEEYREQSIHAVSGILKELSEETTKLDAFFISPDDAVEVIEDIESLSTVIGTSLTVADVHIEDQDTSTGEGILSMNIAADGSWSAMTHLLVLLDMLPFQSELESATLTLTDEEADDAAAKWSFRALLNVSLQR